MLAESGAEMSNSSLKALRIYMAAPTELPSEVKPPPRARKYWTRRGVADWLAARALEESPSLIGIDHGFSFPMAYFQKAQTALELVLDDFQAHWPPGQDNISVQFVRDGICGAAHARSGDPRWRRVAEVRLDAKSVFHFDVQGSVAKSTHAGLPWLLYFRQSSRGRLHFWPFDGWVFPPGETVVAEVYPSLWSSIFPRRNRNRDRHDAYSVAAWLRRTDGGRLSIHLY
jgi:hypothetical protein